MMATSVMPALRRQRKEDCEFKASLTAKQDPFRREKGKEGRREGGRKEGSKEGRKKRERKKAGCGASHL
jgi:hypothetical protein